MATVLFEVEQAGCPSCAARVRAALAPLGTVSEVAIDEQADQATVRTIVLPWFREAAQRNDWSPAEMVVLFDYALLLGEQDLGVAMAHAFRQQASPDPAVGVCYVKALAVSGAVEKADEVLKTIEPMQARLPEPTKTRVSDLRAAIDKLLRK